MPLDQCNCIVAAKHKSRCDKTATKRCKTCGDRLCRTCASKHHAHFEFEAIEVK